MQQHIDKQSPRKQLTTTSKTKHTQTNQTKQNTKQHTKQEQHKQRNQ